MCNTPNKNDKNNNRDTIAITLNFDNEMMHNEKSIKNFIDEMINTKEEEFIIEDNYIGNYSFDITFCIDTSGSMIKYYDNVLELINILFKKSLKFLSNENINVKFGCVIYRDHFPQEKEYVTKSFQLCDSKKIIEILKVKLF